MSFNDKEISTQDGQPISLYKLQWGNVIWRYTSADREIVRTEDEESVTYEPVAINDDGMTQGGSQQNDFTIHAPSNIPIVALFAGTPPAQSIWITVRRQHIGEADAPIYWIGTVGNVRRVDLASIDIIGRVLTATFKRTGLRLPWSKGCPHMLYDGSCRANKSFFSVTKTISTKTGNTITINSNDKPAGYYDGGFIEWEADESGTMDRRGIEWQPGTATFALFGTTDRLEIGMTITLYAGCDRTPETCNSKFNNLPNYGGFAFMAGKSPFDGDPVF